MKALQLVEREPMWDGNFFDLPYSVVSSFG